MPPALRALWRVCIERPWTVFAATLAITLFALLQFPQVRIDTDPENMLPAEQPERVFHNAAKQRFGVPHFGDFGGPCVLMNRKQPCQRLFKRRNSREMVDGLIGEAARQRLDGRHAIAATNGLRSFPTG